MSDKKRKILTLCLIIDRDKNKILLAMKKRGFGAGRWNGFGGKVEAGETIEQATIRECQEEGMVTPLALEKVALHDFEFTNPEMDIMEVHAFVATTWSGEPAETEEMRPQWFSIDAIPYDLMWADDIHWLPQVLTGDKLRTHFLFGADDQVISHEMEVVSNF